MKQIDTYRNLMALRKEHLVFIGVYLQASFLPFNKTQTHQAHQLLQEASAKIIHLALQWKRKNILMTIDVG